MRPSGGPSGSAETPLTRARPLIGAMLTALLVAFAIVRIDGYERDRIHQEARLGAVRQASVLRARLEGALGARLNLASGLAAFARSHPHDLSDFTTFAEGLTKAGIHGVRSLQLAPGAVVTHVHPETGNAGVKGHDLLADPQRRAAVLRSIDERRFVVAGPFPLIQGGTGLVARLPLFVDDETGRSRFWGFATVVLDVDPILIEGGLTPPMDPTYAAALRGRDGLGERGGAVFGDQGIFNRDPVLIDVSMPSGSWQLGVMPVGGWPAHGPSQPVIWIIGAVVSLLAGTVTFQRLHTPIRLRKEIVRATAALRASEEHFRNVSDRASDAIMSTDGQGVVTSWNRAAVTIFGHEPGEAIGCRLSGLIMDPSARVSSDGNPFHQLAERARTEPVAIEAVAMRKDGSTVPIEMTLARWDSAGQVHFTAIVREIATRQATERLQALLRERDFQARKMEAISRLAGGTAHEFNNILNAMLANAESVEAAIGSNHPALPQMLEVVDGGWRAAAIVRELLVFSADAAGEAGGTGTPGICPSEALGRLMPQLRGGLPAGLRLETRIDDDDARVAMDHDQFCHLIWHLYLNGCRAMALRSGTLSIALSTEQCDGDSPFAAMSGPEDGAQLVLGPLPVGEHVLLTIGDDGCGMDGDTLNRAFEPFFTTSRVGEGKGLGLSVVHGLVQRQGGCIAVMSGLDHGTAVRIFLPVTGHGGESGSGIAPPTP
ncbi:MAG: PAS domain S-box protein [Alphaproteobacteria bacterium]